MLEQRVEALEGAITENTAVMRELIERLKAGTTPAPQATAPVPQATAPVPQATAPAAAADAPAADSKAPRATKTTTPKPAADAKPDAAAAPPDYPAAAKALTALIQRKGRDTGIALLKRFGVTKLPELKAERFAELIAACEGENDPVES